MVLKWVFLHLFKNFQNLIHVICTFVGQVFLGVFPLCVTTGFIDGTLIVRQLVFYCSLVKSTRNDYNYMGDCSLVFCAFD